MKTNAKPPPGREEWQEDSSDSDIDSELERRSRARDRRRSRGGGAHKPRVVWHPQMHADFEAAVAALGGAFCATPKAILEHMGGEGTATSLTLANVKSHLQKYRLKEQKRREEEEEAAGRPPDALAAALAAAGNSHLPGGRAGGGGPGAVPPVAAVLRASPPLSPGMVPLTAIGSGEQPQLELPPPLQMPPSPASSGAVASAAGLCLPPHNVAPLPLAIAQPGEELPFADEKLGRQAEAWRRKQQVLAAQAAALQAAPGPPSQPQQLALILLQRENLKCLQALHALHLAQMQQHLDAAAHLREQVDMPVVEVKQEQKSSEDAILNVLAAACLGGSSTGPAESSELGSPSEGADAPAAPMEE